MAPHHHPRRHRCDPTATGPTKQDPCPGQAPPRPAPKPAPTRGTGGRHQHPAPSGRGDSILAVTPPQAPQRAGLWEQSWGPGDAPQGSPLRPSGGVGGQTACKKGAGAWQASRPGMQHAHSAQHTHSSRRASARPGRADGHRTGTKPGLGPAYAAPPPGLWSSRHVPWSAQVCSKGRRGEKEDGEQAGSGPSPTGTAGQAGLGHPPKVKIPHFS